MSACACLSKAEEPLESAGCGLRIVAANADYLACVLEGRHGRKAALKEQTHLAKRDKRDSGSAKPQTYTPAGVRAGVVRGSARDCAGRQHLRLQTQRCRKNDAGLGVGASCDCRAHAGYQDRQQQTLYKIQNLPVFVSFDKAKFVVPQGPAGVESSVSLRMYGCKTG